MVRLVLLDLLALLWVFQCNYMLLDVYSSRYFTCFYQLIDLDWLSVFGSIIGTCWRERRARTTWTFWLPGEFIFSSNPRYTSLENHKEIIQCPLPKAGILVWFILEGHIINPFAVVWQGLPGPPGSPGEAGKPGDQVSVTEPDICFIWRSCRGCIVPPRIRVLRLYLTIQLIKALKQVKERCSFWFKTLNDVLYFTLKVTAAFLSILFDHNALLSAATRSYLDISVLMLNGNWLLNTPTNY